MCTKFCLFDQRKRNWWSWSGTIFKHIQAQRNLHIKSVSIPSWVLLSLLSHRLIEAINMSLFTYIIRSCRNNKSIILSKKIPILQEIYWCFVTGRIQTGVNAIGVNKLVRTVLGFFRGVAACRYASRFRSRTQFWYTELWIMIWDLDEYECALLLVVPT